jgi:thiosulfate dehydrogenase
MDKRQDKELISALVTLSRHIIRLSLVVVMSIIVLLFYLTTDHPVTSPAKPTPGMAGVNSSILVPAAAGNRIFPPSTWEVPAEQSIPTGRTGNMIRYGKLLITHTSDYFGPRGTIAHLSNGMNCQNCHLDGGVRLFANNFAGFISSYPKLSARTGKVEAVSGRIAECFERSLSGTFPDTSKKEVQAIIAYMRWIGKDVKKGEKLFGSATEKISFMNVPADPVKGKIVFMMKCQNCHGRNGEGSLTQDGKSYIYPPLWGEHSYNDGAGMYRIINLAGFVKNNMPFGASYQRPQLTDEEAWNVAAFVNTQPRPHRDQHNDWKDLNKKPIDFPFGPYLDAFSERQHKYGPFSPIVAAQKETIQKKS